MVRLERKEMGKKRVGMTVARVAGTTVARQQRAGAARRARAHPGTEIEDPGANVRARPRCCAGPGNSNGRRRFKSNSISNSNGFKPSSNCFKFQLIQKCPSRIPKILNKIWF
jgi:hypothetical protein